MGSAGLTTHEKRCLPRVVSQPMQGGCRLTLLMTFPDLLIIVTVSVSCIL